MLTLTRRETVGFSSKATNTHTRSGSKFRLVCNVITFLPSGTLSVDTPVHLRLKVKKKKKKVKILSGVPSQKPKEQQRSVLRPAVLQAPPAKSHLESSEFSHSLTKLRLVKI